MCQPLRPITQVAPNRATLRRRMPAEVGVQQGRHPVLPPQVLYNGARQRHHGFEGEDAACTEAGFLEMKE